MTKNELMTKEEILSIINLFDPIGLLALGAPDHEYELEAKLIFARIIEKIENGVVIFSVNQIKKIVVEVFEQMFSPLEINAEKMNPLSKVIWILLEYKRTSLIAKLDDILEQLPEDE